MNLTVDLQRMMDRQRELQLALGGSHPSDRPPADQMNYLREMVLACTDELHEALTETGWKTWASTDHIHRDAYLAELIDAWQFLMNLFSLVNATATEIEHKLEIKHAINWARHRSGTYAANGEGKCPNCKRAMDDPAVKCNGTVCYGIAS